MEWFYIAGVFLALAALIVGWFLLPAPIKLALSLFVQMLPTIMKRMTPEDEKAFNDFLRSSPSPREIAEWHRKRRRAGSGTRHRT